MSRFGEIAQDEVKTVEMRNIGAADVSSTSWGGMLGSHKKWSNTTRLYLERTKHDIISGAPEKLEIPACQQPKICFAGRVPVETLSTPLCTAPATPACWAGTLRRSSFDVQSLESTGTRTP